MDQPVYLRYVQRLVHFLLQMSALGVDTSRKLEAHYLLIIGCNIAEKCFSVLVHSWSDSTDSLSFYDLKSKYVCQHFFGLLGRLGHVPLN